jgi:hypothetical protein
MLPPDVSNLLDRLGTRRKPHEGGRTLREHLEGTYGRLIRWGNAEPVCLGGLFHSIYGTEFYPHPSASLDDRPTIRACIGEEAERFAYLYSFGDRARLLANIGKPDAYAVLDRCADVEIPIDRSTFCALMEIEFANVLDLAPPIEEVPEPTLRRWHDRLKGAAPHVSEGAWREFRRYFATLTRPAAHTLEQA